MRTYRIFLPAIIVLAAACGVAQARSGSPKDIAFIKNAYHQMDQATATNDVDKFVSYLAPNFEDIDEHGTVTAHSASDERQQMEELIQQATDLQINIHTTVKSIKFSGDKAIVTATGAGTMSATKNGTAMKARLVGVEQDVWIKSGSGWLETKSKSITSKITPLP